MRRRVNLKAVLILMASGLALGAAVHFAHGFQVKRNAHVLLDQAGQLEQEGRAEEAVGYFDQYLGMVPTDDEALARYGLLLNQLARNPRAKLKAYLVLSQALRRDERRADVRRRVAELALDLRRFADAQEDLLRLLKEQPDDAELMELLGRAEAGARNFEAAEEWLEKALRKAPGRVPLYEEYARLLRGPLKRPGDADDVIERLIRTNPRSVPGRLAAGRYFKAAGATDQAAAQVAFALRDLASEDADLLLLASDLAHARKDGAGARQYLERGLSLYAADARFRPALARLDLEQGQRKEALAHLSRALEHLPKEPDTLWNLANLFLDAGEVDQVQDLIGRLGKNGSGPAADFLKARVLLQQGSHGQARTALEKLRAEPGLPPGMAKYLNLLLGQCYEQLANPEQQLAAYQRVLDVDPQSPAARQGAAAALAALGRLDQAVKQYGALAHQDPALRRTLARLLFVQTLRLPPAERRWADVEQVLQALPPEEQSTTEVQLLRAEVLAARDDLEAARKLAEQERDRDPKQPGPWLFLAALAEKQGKADSIPALLDDAERRAGPRVEWLLARAAYWAKANPKAAKEWLAGLEASVQDFPEAEQNRLLLGLGQVYSGLGDPADAGRLWRSVARRQPKNLGVRLALFEAALQANQEAEARDLVSQINGIEGGGPLTAVGEARLQLALARRGDPGALAQARLRLAEAASLRPNWSRVDVLQAEAYDFENQKDKALEKYQAALEHGDRSLATYRRTLQLLYERGRYADANHLLHTLPERALALPDLGRLAAELPLLGLGRDEAGDPAGTRDQALQQARKVVADDSKDFRDHLWLGQIAWMANHLPEAEKAFRRARDLADQEPAPWAALLLFLARTDAPKAEAEIAQVRTRLPADQAPRVLAPCYEALGQLEAAEKQYLTLLAARPGDPDRLRQTASFYFRTGQAARAEPYLNQLLDDKTQAPPAVAAWARRSLALVLVFKGGYAYFQQGLTLLEDNARANGESVEDQRARALILATQPAHRQEAIELFERFAARSGGSPAEQFLLAQLYERDGNWTKARAHFVALLNADAKSPVYLAAHVRGLLAHQETAEAQRWVDKLAAVAPGKIETVELRARVLHAQGRSDEAAALLQKYAGENDAPLDRVALLLEQVGRATEGEALCRKFVGRSKDPQAVLVLAQFLGRQKRTREALELCEQALQTCPVEPVARVGLSLVRGQGAEDQQRVERWLTDAMQKQPDKKVTFLAMLADLNDARGRFDESAALYRQILQHDPGHLMALNNLAYVLALKQGQPAEALALTEKALALAGPNAELLDTRALVLMKNRQPELALKDMQKVVQEVPTPIKHFHLAEAQYLLKNRPAAVASLQKASELGLKPDDVPPLERPAYYQLTGELGRK